MQRTSKNSRSGQHLKQHSRFFLENHSTMVTEKNTGMPQSLYLYPKGNIYILFEILYLMLSGMPQLQSLNCLKCMNT